MKKYKANEELERILFNQGFLNTSSESDVLKGKKSFKLTKRSKKEIYFDYINIKIENESHVLEDRIEITKSELKALLLFFELSPSDYKEIDPTNGFKFHDSLERLKSMEKELEFLNEFDSNSQRRIKLQRILDAYNNIDLKTNL